MSTDSGIIDINHIFFSGSFRILIFRISVSLCASRSAWMLTHVYRVIPIIALGLSLGMYKLDEDESSKLCHTNRDDAILMMSHAEPVIGLVFHPYCRHPSDGGVHQTDGLLGQNQLRDL